MSHQWEISRFPNPFFPLDDLAMDQLEIVLNETLILEEIKHAK
jgi:hypothetical protein